MNVECVPCLQRQAIEAMRMGRVDDETTERILRAAIGALSAMQWNERPPILAQRIHALLRDHLGYDPYYGIKKRCNESALESYPVLASTVSSSQDPLVSAVRIAIAGNIIDFGPTSDFDFEGTVENFLTRPFALDGTPELKASLEDASSVLLLADNAGEIVCDRLLIETIHETYGVSDVTVAIKGGPILNDATEEDWRDVGFNDLGYCTPLRVGNGEMTSGIPRESNAFRHVMDSYDTIIAKGQGNYEMLSENEDIFFLLTPKCPVLAESVGVPVGSLVCTRGQKNTR
ncbi:MAG TPA: DUF89 family protein [Methanomicrobia archaeon]|nr:DUF89 family protein [Methanomicrobia archaeon]